MDYKGGQRHHLAILILLGKKNKTTTLSALAGVCEVLTFSPGRVTSRATLENLIYVAFSPQHENTWPRKRSPQL